MWIDIHILTAENRYTCISENRPVDCEVVAYRRWSFNTDGMAVGIDLTALAMTKVCS